MRVLDRVGALGMVVALSTGCGKVEGNKTGADPVAGTAPAPLARADYEPAFAQLSCEGFADCCESLGVPVDVASCESQVTQILKDINAMFAKTTTYDAAAAAECLQASAGFLRCGHRQIGVASPEACQRIFVGHAKPGDACKLDTDCQAVKTGSVICSYDSSSGANESGTCTVEMPGQLGEPCLRSCLDGLLCDGTQHCAVPVPIGSACLYTDACEGGGYCVQSRCHELLADGEACRVNETCQNGSCVDRVCVPFAPTAERCRSGQP